MLVSLLQFYILLIAWMLAQCQASCDSGWFGQNCTFMCHCLSSETCDDDGRCPNNEQCKKGFFGPGCQYVDVSQLTTSDGAAQYLRDGDDTTCNTQPEATDVVVNLTEAVPFTWFRVALKDKKNMLNFTTKLNGTVNCRNERKYPVNDKLVDVSCDRGPMMTSLKVSGPAAGSICSIYISGGRNVALRQTAIQSTIYNDTGLESAYAKNAVDGHSSMEFNDKHCASTNYDPPNWWALTFSQPQVIYKIVLHNRIWIYSRFTKFYVETFDKDNKRISFQNYSYPFDGLAKYELTFPTKVPIASFNVTQLLTLTVHKDRVMTLCEVEAFGDPLCPVETYGFFCEKKCQCNTTDTCHPFSGVCARGCQPGFYGLNCSLRCVKNCLHDVCELRSGNCLQCVPGYVGPRCDTACDPGRFGQECGLYCSDRCANNVCNNTNGLCICKPQFTKKMCTDCAATWYGAECEHNCSELCGNKLCDRYTGVCLACVGKRIGPFCQDCPVKYFGPLCESKCNPNCLNMTCDQVSGTCLGCEEGYEGKKCWKIQKNYAAVWLILIPIVTGLFLLLFCRKRRSAVEDYEE